MKFADLMNVVDELQFVKVIIGEDVIIGEACALAKHIANEVTEANVSCIAVVNGELKVWVDCDEIS